MTYELSDEVHPLSAPAPALRQPALPSGDAAVASVAHATVHDLRTPRKWPVRGIICLSLLLATVLGVHWRTLDYALLGFDTYPLIIASRIQNTSDFIGTFTEKMMDGRYPGGDFYRPVQNLVLAAECAVWGVKPFGYQLTTLCFLAACTLLLFAVLRKLLGGRAWIGPLIASLYFALHPSLLAATPVPARRVELLVMMFLLLAMGALPVGNQKRRPIRYIAAALCVMLAAGSKESGAIGVGLVACHQLFFSMEGRLVANLRRAAWATVSALLAFAAFMLNRWLVIGGLGGHHQDGPDTSIAALLTNIRQYAPEFITATFCPWPVLARWSAQATAAYAAGALCAVAIIYLIVAEFTTRRRLASLSTSDESSPPNARPWNDATAIQYAGRVIGLGFAWIAANIVINGLAGTFNPRYVMLCMVGVAIVLAATVEAVVITLRRHLALIPVGLLPAGVAAAVVIAALYTSPLHTAYPEWAEASSLQSGFLDDLQARLDKAKPGQRVDERRMPFMSDEPVERPRIEVVAMLAHYSIQAWADLVFADKKIRVLHGGKAAPNERAKPDEVLLVVWYKQAREGRFPGQIRPVPKSRQESGVRTGNKRAAKPPANKPGKRRQAAPAGSPDQ